MVSQPDHTSTHHDVYSQPQRHHPSASLTVRGPSSVTSRPSSSRSRSKRYNRSHAGGTSYFPQNEFPVFSNSGDVDIVIRVGAGEGQAENRYLLHKHTLTRCSGFFEASTSVEWSRAKMLAGGNELARIGEDAGSAVDGDADSGVGGTGLGGNGEGRKRWRYELDSGSGDGDIPMLVQRDDSRDADSRPALPSIFGPVPGSGPDRSSRSSHSQPSSHPLSRSKPTNSHSQTSSMPSNHSFFRSVANLSLSSTHHPRNHDSSSTSSRRQHQPHLSQADEDLLRDYDNLFRIFYNYPPVLDGVNVADAYVQCKSLLALADLYDALPVVGPRVDHHLLQFQSRLWKQIAKYPISYLRLGYLARSKIIFQEALIHVVGQWPVGERTLRSMLPDVVLDIIEDKVDELEEAVSRVEGRLFRLNLTTSRGERVTPGTNYLDWLAVSLFRQWLADNTSPQPATTSSRQVRFQTPSQPPTLSVGRAYRTLGSSNPASYLSHDECKRFLKLTPDLYSRDNLRRFERRLDEVKAMARDIVRPLMDSDLELDACGAGASGGRGSSASGDAIGYLTCTAVGNRDLPWPVGDQ